MEMSGQNYRTLLISFVVAVILSAMLYSCSTQKTSALGIVSKRLAKIGTSSINIQQQKDTIKPKLTKEEIEFSRKINFVLDNSGKNFDNVSSIASSMNSMSGRLDKLTDVILTRATELRMKNDSLVSLVFLGNKQNKELLLLALSESKARIANEKRTEETDKLNKANTKAQGLYTTIGLTFLFGLLFINLFFWLDIRRLRLKVKLITQHG